MQNALNKQMPALFCKYLPNESSDLHEIWKLSSQDSNWFTHEDQAFVVEIFAKQYWHLFNPWFSIDFAYYQKFEHQSSCQIWKLHETPWNFWKQNFNLIGKRTPLPAPSLYSSPSMKFKLFFNHYQTPCTKPKVQE